MKLTTWIRQQGGITKVGKRLGVSKQRVAAWLGTRALPRPAIMQRIVRASNGRVGYADMVKEFLSTK